LGDCLGSGDFTREKFLLIVEWQGEEAAVWIGVLVIERYAYVDHELRTFFDPYGLAWKTVTFI
jgi:hypothetical protein